MAGRGLGGVRGELGGLTPQPWDTRTPMADRNPPTDAHLALAVSSPGSPARAPGDSVLIAEVGDELRGGFRALAAVQRGVSVFGSARTGPDDPDYELARA